VRYLWAGALVAAAACSSVTSQYQKAAETDTAEAYRAFLRRNPGSEYEEAAYQRLDELMFTEASEDGSAEALRSYLERSVLSYHWSEADSLLERALLSQKAAALRDSIATEESGELVLELGETLLDLGDGSGAAVHLRQADSLGADAFRVHLGLARSHSLTDDDTRALAEFQEALTLRPGSSAAYRYLARHHRHRGQHAKALAAYLEAVERAPTDYDLRFELGLTYLDVPNAAEAVREFKGVVDLDPERLEALYWLGLAYAQMGDSDLAIVWLRRYLVQVRELGDQAAVERTEAKMRQIRPAGSTQAKVIPGQTYKNQEKKQESRGSTGRGWANPFGGRGRRAGRGDPWDR
jgi:tetratricopeptide (TPR) repeat protein